MTSALERRTRWLSLFLVAVGVTSWIALARTTGALASASANANGRVIVLGFDGADARTVAELMQRGQLPNLKKLADEGTFAPLGTTNPAESPVAWAALNSGANPAKTGIPGFVMREYLGGTPYPNKGFAKDGVQVPIKDLRGAPLPTWSRAKYAAIGGVAALLVFALVFGALLRLKLVPTLVLSLVLAGVGAWGAAALRGYLPSSLPVVKNPIQTAPFWEIAAKSGVACRVIDAAQAWDREPVDNAKVLCGLGVPDAHGSYTSFYVYTTDELYFARRVEDAASDTSSGGKKLRVDERDGVIESQIFGPNNFCRESEIQTELTSIQARRDNEPNLSYKESERLNTREAELKTELDASAPVTLPLRIEKKKGSAKVTMGTASQDIAEGAWSDWYRLTFELNPLVKVSAIARCKIVHLDDPYFEMYVDTLQYDPATPPFWQPLSEPASYAPELAKDIRGPFETVGWACMTHPFKDDVIDATTFLEDIEFTTHWREALTFDALKKNDWTLFMSCFSEPDRVQHMMYQYYDPTHPLYDAKKAEQKIKFYGQEIAFKDVIPACYAQVDRLVGRVMSEVLKPGDTLILCADHGFQSFRRQVHLNNWLAQQGYLVLKEGVTRQQTAIVSKYVDWSKTRAYSLGLGMIFVNVKGGDSKVGIVDPKDKDALLREIGRKLLDATDPDHPDKKLCKSAVVISDIHKGPHLALEADMMVGFEAGYRISWGSTLGGISLGADGKVGPAVVDNDKNWSGDHVSVDTELVRGIFFCNRKLEMPAGGVDLLHVAPTALAVCGVAVPPDMDLPPLKFAP